MNTPVWASTQAVAEHPVLSLEAELILPMQELLGEVLAHRAVGALRLALTDVERRQHADHIRMVREHYARDDHELFVYVID